MMDGRRWSDGLHQAVEAKEGSRSSPRTRRSPRSPSRIISACIPSFPGMTGTAATEAAEFYDIYKMNVVTIPTNMPVRRVGRRRRILQEPGRQVRRDRQGDQGEAGHRPAGPGRHRLDREIGAALRISQEGEDQARGAERPLSRAGSAYRRPGGPARARSPSPPTWPAAAPTSSSAAMSSSASQDELGDMEDGPEARQAAIERIRQRGRRGEGEGDRRRRPVRARHRAPREPAHRQPAARPLGPPGRSRPVAASI